MTASISLVAVSKMLLREDAAHSKHVQYKCVFSLPSFLLPFFFLRVISCSDIHFSTLCLTFITLLGCHLRFPTSGSFATYLHKVANAYKTVCLF